MNKKQLASLVESLVSQVSLKHNISEDEARVLVGLSIKQNSEKILEGIALPTFGKVAA